MNMLTIDEAYELTQKLHGAPDTFRINTNLNWNLAPAFFSPKGNSTYITLSHTNNDISKVNINETGLLDKLSILLWMGYGCQKIRVSLESDLKKANSGLRPKYFPQRAVASGGAAYPNEIYINFNADKQYIYRYSPNYHALIAHNQSINTDNQSDIKIYINVKFERTCFKYKTFAYRLSAVDTGAVLGRLIAILNALNIDFDLDFDFNGYDTNELLKINDNLEGTYAILSIKHNSVTAINDVINQYNIKNDASLNTNAAQEQSCIPAEMIALHQRAHYCDTQEENKIKTQTNLKKYRTYPLTDLFEASLNRASLANFFTGESSSKKVLIECIEHCVNLLKSVSHHCKGGSLPNLNFYCSVFNLSDLESGLYFYNQNQLILIDKDDHQLDITKSLHLSSANIALSSFIIHITGNIDWRGNSRGLKFYRILQMYAGIATEAISLAANMSGLSAHPYLGYNSNKIKKIYKIIPSDQEILCQICIGDPDHNNIYHQIMI